MDIFDRTIKLIGEKNLSILKNSKVAVFGIGGVGSFVVEALVRAGIGSILIVDKDVVDVSNINRQLYALISTIGKPKVDVAKQRILDINPDINIQTKQVFFNKDTINQFDFSQFDYIVDVIDTITSKVLLISTAKSLGVDIISCMGTGNKLDPTKFEVADIYDTQNCKLAKIMRKQLKNLKIENLKVVYSSELAPSTLTLSRTPASISFVPSVAGLIIASEVVKDLIWKNTKK